VWCYLAATSAFDSPFTFPNPATVLQNPGVAKNERFLWFFGFMPPMPPNGSDVVQSRKALPSMPPASRHPRLPPWLRQPSAMKIYPSRTVALPRSLLSPAFHHLRPTTELNALSPGATPSRTLAPLHTNVGRKSLQQTGPLLQDSRSAKYALHRQAGSGCRTTAFRLTPPLGSTTQLESFTRWRRSLDRTQRSRGSRWSKHPRMLGAHFVFFLSPFLLGLTALQESTPHCRL
jgi:hypothetical protein